MRDLTFRPKRAAPEVVVKVLDFLVLTKMRSIEFLETWLRETRDEEIRAGLEPQLADERRHLRLLIVEMRKSGGRTSPNRRDPRLSRPLGDIKALSSDLHRICAFHRGIKAFTLNRCGHLIPVVGQGQAELLEQIARDEERHIRWADIRLARLLTRDEMRACNLLMGRVWTSLELTWEKTWRDVVKLAAG